MTGKPISPNDYQNFVETRRAAEAGIAKSQYNLGLMYANGVGVQQDFEQAMRWYHKSAEKGFAAAQYILAGKYATGQGVKKDLRQALSWYLKASERGNSRALFKLGQMLSVPQEEFANECFEQAAEKGVLEAQMIIGARLEADGAAPPGKANDWYLRAAENGLPAAQYIVGTQYHGGKGVPADLAQAIAWYRKAARQGFAAAQTRLGMMYARGEGLTKDNRQAVSWLGRAAEQGDAEAQFQLAMMYEQGLGLAADLQRATDYYEMAAQAGDARAQLRLAQLLDETAPEQALALYQQAAAQGHPEARYLLGRLCALGERLPRDLDRALELLLSAAAQGVHAAKVFLAEFLDREASVLSTHWYRQAAESGHEQAQCQLAGRLATGQGAAPSQQEAHFWYVLAAEKELPAALHAVAEAYLEAADSRENEQQAIDYLRKAAKQGYAPAQNTLGALYATGRYVPKDNRQAASWWLKAAEQGNAEAQFSLGRLFEQGGGAAADRHAEQWYLRAIEQSGDARSLMALIGLQQKNESPTAALWIERAAEMGLSAGLLAHAETLRKRTGQVSTAEISLYVRAAAQGEQGAWRRLSEVAAETPTRLVTLLQELAGEHCSENLAPKQGTLAPSTVEATETPALTPLQTLQHNAQAGDPRAQWALGMSYERGEMGLGKDAQKAMTCFQQAARAGFAAAQAALAYRLATGKAGTQDLGSAIHWWEKAAEQGDAESQYNLALMYERGQGVAEDVQQAMHWFAQAADQGLVAAQVRLGLALATGKTGQVNLLEAYAWFVVAGATGNEIANANRDYAESLMTAQAIKQGKRLAEQWMKKIRKTGK